jgi:tRNA(Ile)-lysidine synthase
MALLQGFIQFVKQERLFQRNALLLLAVSGGVDSVVLCELCNQAGFRFIIAHCNFKLRGEESNRDEKFVQELASKYKVPFKVKIFETEQYAAANKTSIQVAARELRYTWFNELLHHLQTDETLSTRNTGDRPLTNTQLVKPACLLTAHHADDNIETMMMNLFKGTGITGLRGILPKQQQLIRPLLFAPKSEIIAFADAQQLKYVEDSSNESDKYTRNYFRNQLIPGIQNIFPKVQENLLNNMQRFRETALLYYQAVKLHKKKLLEPRGKEIFIPVLKLKKLIPLHTIVYEIIKDYGFTAHQVAEVTSLLETESGKYVQSATYRIIKNRNWLVISPNDTEEASTIVINKNDKKIGFEKGRVEFKEVLIEHCQLSTSALVAQLDADEIIYPLLLRKRKQSDYFYPLGMQKKKKLNRFLGDQKISLTEKEHTWLIEMKQKIIWITGIRIDDRFKITGKTRRVLQVTLIPHG